MSSNRAVRLPKLERLRVKNPVVEQGVNPCTVMMSSLLNCWASYAEGSDKCKLLEVDLKTCMENKVKHKTSRSSINYHANRLFPRISGKPHD